MIRTVANTRSLTSRTAPQRIVPRPPIYDSTGRLQSHVITPNRPVVYLQEHPRRTPHGIEGLELTWPITSDPLFDPLFYRLPPQELCTHRLSINIEERVTQAVISTCKIWSMTVRVPYVLAGPQGWHVHRVVDAQSDLGSNRTLTARVTVQPSPAPGTRYDNRKTLNREITFILRRLPHLPDRFWNAIIPNRARAPNPAKGGPHTKIVHRGPAGARTNWSLCNSTWRSIRSWILSFTVDIRAFIDYLYSGVAMFSWCNQIEAIAWVNEASFF